MILERVPKNTYCANEKLELEVYDASAKFTIDILRNLYITPGYHTAIMCYELNKGRKHSAVYKFKPSNQMWA